MNRPAMKPADRRQLRAMSADLVRKPTSEPINKVMFNEGKRDAVDIVNACKALLRSPVGRESLIAKLRAASKGRPLSIVKGFDHIITMIETAPY
jgi:hypothetical protein